MSPGETSTGGLEPAGAGDGRWSAPRLILAVLLSAAAAGGGCGSPGEAPGGSDRWAGSVDTTADGRVTVTNTGGGAWREDTVVAERSVMIGELGLTEGTEETTFGMVTGLAVDGEGRVYVADAQASTVRAYSPAGEPLGLVAGEGEGPAEVEFPQLLAARPEGRLAVADTRGLTLLRPPSPGALPTEAAGTWTHPSFPQPYRPLRLDCRKAIYYPHKQSRRGLSGAAHHYFRLDSSAVLRDTVRVPRMDGLPAATPFIRMNQGGGRMVPGVDVPPLSPVPSWDVTPAGELVLGEARSYELVLVGSGGDTLRTFRRSVERRPIPEAVRAESTAALRTRMDTLPVPASRIENLSEEVAELQLPERYPAYQEVQASTDGRIWVERPPLEDRSDATPYDVFGADGVYLGTVVVPVRFTPGRGFSDARLLARPRFTGNRVYGVVVDSVTGVQRVAGFSFEAPEREEGAPVEPPPACSGGSS